MNSEIRELQGNDLFLLLSIFNKLDIIDELTAVFSGSAAKGKSKAEAEKIGIEIMAKLAKKALGNVAVIQDDLNNLLSQLSGKTVEEVKQAKMSDYVNTIISIFNDSQFKDFFSSLVS